MIIIDAKDAIVGRIATVAAKKALQGEKVAVINCEKAVLSGTKKRLVADWKRKFSMGVPRKGPFIHRSPDRFVRRIIRGMLPYKKPRGAEAFKNIMCYIGAPEMQGDSLVIEGASAERLELYVTVGTICKELGGNNGEN